MTTTSAPLVPPVLGRLRAVEVPLPAAERASARRAEIALAAAELVEASAAEARAVGAQLRCIHRLWCAAQAALTEARLDSLARAESVLLSGGTPLPDPLGPLQETGRQVVLDVAAEVGPALHLPAGSAVRRVEDAVLLAEMLPEVLAALEAGRIGPRQADVLVEQWRELIVEAPVAEHAGHDLFPVEAVYRLVVELLACASHATAAQLRALARRCRTVLVAGAEERARRTARKRRGVWVEPAEHGTVYLHALLDAPVALAVRDRLDALVRDLGEHVPAPDAELGLLPQPWLRESAEERSAGELRADVLADLLLDGILPEEPGFPRGIRGRVTVTVPLGLLTAAGAAHFEKSVETGEGVETGDRVETGAAGGRHPAVLSGYGPISAEVARQLAAAAGSWHRILTHPGTGVVLDHDRTVYAVPRDLRRLVELRDETCRFPGCRRPAEQCDLDHTVAWQDGGRTAEDNLAALCRQHHLVKHRPGFLGRWSVRRVPAGPGGGSSAGPPTCRSLLEWTSPGGLVHRTVAESGPLGVATVPARAPSGPFLEADDPPPF